MSRSLAVACGDDDEPDPAASGGRGGDAGALETRAAATYGAVQAGGSPTAAAGAGGDTSPIPSSGGSGGEATVTSAGSAGDSGAGLGGAASSP